MKIIDMHADIGFDILDAQEKGMKDVLKNAHLSKLKQGEIALAGAASFFDGSEDWDRMQKMVTACRKEIQANVPDIIWVQSAQDMETIETSDKTHIMMTVEGMCGIKEMASDKIQWLYDQGVRIASLCWNEENAVATGVKGSVRRGLTEMGKEVIHKMNDLNMVIDVSHNNEKTFWDILDTSTKPVIATHSNARMLCQVERNLTDQQIRALAEQGGLIGLNAARRFIWPQEQFQDSEHLALHARHIADLVGVQHVACGFDFMDFLGDYGSKDMGHDLGSALAAQNLIVSLRKAGFSEEEVQDIAYRNALAFFQAQI